MSTCRWIKRWIKWTKLHIIWNAVLVAFLHLNFDCIVVVREGVLYRPFSLASVLLTIDSGGKKAAKRMKKLIASLAKVLGKQMYSFTLLPIILVHWDLSQAHPPGHQRILHREIHPAGVRKLGRIFIRFIIHDDFHPIFTECTFWLLHVFQPE